MHPALLEGCDVGLHGSIVAIKGNTLDIDIVAVINAGVAHQRRDAADAIVAEGKVMRLGSSAKAERSRMLLFPSLCPGAENSGGEISKVTYLNSFERSRNAPML